MNADAFRQFYDYHFSENRKLWNYVMELTPEQFSQAASYSRGSVRDQVVHLTECEDMWFSELQNVEPLAPVSADQLDDRDVLRAHWDQIEARIRAYLTSLTDVMLFTQPIEEPEEDKDLVVWQVLLHVANHATDHRAQILRQINDLGIDTKYQDYIFHIFERASAAVDNKESQ
jgi:uncharacterized damage-inducible protein DinB